MSDKERKTNLPVEANEAGKRASPPVTQEQINAALAAAYNVFDGTSYFPSFQVRLARYRTEVMEQTKLTLELATGAARAKGELAKQVLLTHPDNVQIALEREIALMEEERDTAKLKALRAKHALEAEAAAYTDKDAGMAREKTSIAKELQGQYRQQARTSLAEGLVKQIDAALEGREAALAAITAASEEEATTKADIRLQKANLILANLLSQIPLLEAVDAPAPVPVTPKRDYADLLKTAIKQHGGSPTGDELTFIDIYNRLRDWHLDGRPEPTTLAAWVVLVKTKHEAGLDFIDAVKVRSFESVAAAMQKDIEGLE